MTQPSRWTGAIVLGVAIVAAASVASAQQPGDASSFPDIEEHFTHGSVGAEAGSGLPYWVWRVLPIVFADKLPDRPGEGYERLGFLAEGARHGRPIGTSMRMDRVPLVGLNCATCHVGTIRESPDAPRRVVLGMPANQMDLQGYANFLTACARDPRFTASTIIAAIREIDPGFSLFDRFVYRFFVVGRVKRGILDRAAQNAWFDARPPQGPGRVDTFNPYKVLLGLPLDGDQIVGTADLPSLWNQRIRRGLALHWDGNNDSLAERNRSAATGAGASAESIDLASIQRIEDWILDLPAPAYPAARIDAGRRDQGREVYQAACARCHAVDGAELGQVVPVAQVGTDRERLDSFSAELAPAMGRIGEGYPWQFRRFRKTDGYVNAPLDGLWLRAPYLHNGSVPSLRALLFPEERPTVFYRAYDVYDWDDVGFISSGEAAEREGVRFDTTLRGNGNGGHLYGTDLAPEARETIIEYLKTL
jgi:mono/diheme cytochrome c family protein